VFYKFLYFLITISNIYCCLSVTECVCLIIQHAHALELLSDNMYDGAHVLDVGSGSGYLTACMAMLVILLLVSLFLYNTS